MSRMSHTMVYTEYQYLLRMAALYVNTSYYMTTIKANCHTVLLMLLDPGLD